MDKTLKARVLAVLKAVEFAGFDYEDPWNCCDNNIYRCCPVCGSENEGKHYDDCELAALIKEMKQ